jgi:nucleoside-diphosphate-sugar epimerase
MSEDLFNKESCRGVNVAITGGAGFIGSHLAEKYLLAGAKVEIIDNFLRGSKVGHLKGNKNLAIHEADVRDSDAMNKILKNMDIVFHLAAVVGVEETQIAPLEVLDVEIRGTENILNSAVKNKVKKVIFGSSSEVYGDSKELMKEDAILSPKSTYAVTKLVGEEYCKAFYQRYGLEFVILRYFNVYGPRQDERFVISRFMRRLMDNQVLYIYGDGKQTRDFTYIEDAVNITMLSATKDAAKCDALNVGAGATTSINELAKVIIKVMGMDARKPVYIDYDKTRPREIEIYSRTADISKTQNKLQYVSKISLDEGIRQLERYYMTVK